MDESRESRDRRRKDPVIREKTWKMLFIEQKPYDTDKTIKKIFFTEKLLIDVWSAFDFKLICLQMEEEKDINVIAFYLHFIWQNKIEEINYTFQLIRQVHKHCQEKRYPIKIFIFSPDNPEHHKDLVAQEIQSLLTEGVATARFNQPIRTFDLNQINEFIKRPKI